MSHPERIIPDETDPGIVALHLKRYAFALPYAAGKEVLDAACGAGYGTEHLGSAAVRVVGVDRSDEAIAYARDRYRAPNVRFEVMDVADLRFPDHSFDVVCSFETIEHVADGEALVREVARVLRAGGVFVVSTPRAPRTTRRPANPFHEVEYSQADFEQLLRRYFDAVEVYGQRRLQTRRHRALQRLDVLGLRRRFAFLRRAAPLLGTEPMATLADSDIAIDRRELHRATELVAVCRNPRAS